MNKVICLAFVLLTSCGKNILNKTSSTMTAEKILGNVNYQAICYGGYRTKTRDIEPTTDEIKED